MRCALDLGAGRPDLSHPKTAFCAELRAILQKRVYKESFGKWGPAPRGPSFHSCFVNRCAWGALVASEEQNGDRRGPAQGWVGENRMGTSLP